MKSFVEPEILYLIASLSGLIYWLVVFIRAYLLKKRTGKSVNVAPGSLKEKILWLGWFFVIVLWIAVPFMAGLDNVKHLFQPFWNWSGASSFWTGVTMILLGYAGTWWCYWALGKYWRLGVNWKEKGALITHGPYAFMRHPLYFFQIGMVLGIFVLLPNIYVLTLLIVQLLCVTSKIHDEEKYLSATHGDQYKNYTRKTGTLWPKFRWD